MSDWLECSNGVLNVLADAEKDAPSAAALISKVANVARNNVSAFDLLHTKKKQLCHRVKKPTGSVSLAKPQNFSTAKKEETSEIASITAGTVNEAW